MEKPKFPIICILLIGVIVALCLWQRSRVAIHAGAAGTVARQSDIAGPVGASNGATGASVAGAGEVNPAPEPTTTSGSILVSNPPTNRVPDREIFASQWGHSGRAVLDDLAKWSDEYAAASGDAREAMRARGIELAKARRAAMLELIQADPREALANTPPIRVRQKLPQEVQGLLENRISAMGNVGRIFGVAPPGSKTPVKTEDIAVIEDHQYFAHRYGGRAIRNGYQDISIHGVVIDDQLALSSSPVKVLEEGESYSEITADCVVTNNKQVLAPGDKPDEKSTALYGTHAYTMCCPFCVQTFDEQKIAAEGTVSSPMALSDSGIPGTAGFPGKPPVAKTNGPKKIIFLRVQPSDAVALGQGFPSSATPESFQSMTFSDSDNWNARMMRTSYGKTWFSQADVTPVLTLPENTAYYTGNGYAFWPWMRDAVNAAYAAGYQVWGNYQILCVCHSEYSQFGAAGWGATDGSGFIWANGSFQVHLFDHEGGHAYGLPHANSWTSPDSDPLSPNRSHLEYGDNSDPMGYTWGTGVTNDFNVYYKSFCSWLPDSSVLSVSHSGTYRIRQFDSGSILTGSPMALKISRDSDMDLWVGYRGTSISQSNYNAGAYVLSAGAKYITDSHVLDMNTPSGNTDDAPLAQGQSFTDTASGIQLTTSARGGVDGDKYMYVKVAFPPGYTGTRRLLVNGGIYAFRNLSFNKYLTSNNAGAGENPIVETYKGDASQQWVVWRNDDGSYSFNRQGSDVWLDALANGGGDYTNIIQFTRNGSDAQRWDLLLQYDGYLKIRHRNTNQVLTADAGANGDMITYNDFWPGTEQRWEPVLLGMSEGSYRLTPRHAQALGLGVRNQATYGGAEAEQQTWGSGAFQRWTLQGLGNGEFRIYPTGQASQALAAVGSSDGAKAVTVPWTASPEQRWTFASSGNGWFRLTPAHAGNLCLQISGGSTAAGTSATLGTYTGAAQQQWQFIDPEL